MLSLPPNDHNSKIFELKAMWGLYHRMRGVLAESHMGARTYIGAL